MNKTGLWFLLLMLAPGSQADQLRVAVASNFVNTLEQLASGFKQQTGHELLISSGSTGQLYAQITQGAPFDLFLAADTERPARLVAEGLATGLMVYARGQLELLVNQAVTASCEAWLNDSTTGFLAIANPDLAPYGAAASHYLQKQLLADRFKSRLVMGENVAQATHLVVSGNARAGLLAASMLADSPLPAGSCRWRLPLNDYPAVEQGMVTLKRGAQLPAVQAFRTFLQSSEALSIIAEQGFVVEQGVD